ncbi:hypothetical protein D0862_00421 [Hortaea werneckii]|uniref:THO complex subunit 2 n=2 Tax=Hortaea werneckii TaxID=91943 RepID=A0A3M7HYV2_HORWE|nr:hypothetical protein KC320_g1140 [Hortaea werneckii]RMZ18295.1 hypothetical protein D0862_00421 [Hortaea werneckii]
MAPGSAKRKRPDRQFSHDDGASRPSPHRPENLNMAQRTDGGGGRRGGRDSRRQSRQGGQMDSVNALPVGQRNVHSPQTQHLQPQVAQSSGTPAAATSRTSTPVQQTGTPAPQPTEEGPKEPPPSPAPYAYEHVTEQLVDSWQGSGKQSLLATAKESDEMAMSIILQELLRSALDGRLDGTEAGLVVRQLVADRQQDDGVDVTTLFLNTLSMCDESEAKRPALAQLVAATNIDPELIRQDLDTAMLQNLGLVRNIFQKMRARKTTNMLYRQANYNLLREETEGYAKLLTEYFNIAEEASGNREVSDEMAQDAFQRVKALVGAFDLDPGRVLDITLDISANALVKAYGFFIKFYRCSSWWPDDSFLDNVKWERDEGPTALPPWALPGSNGNAYAEDESMEMSVLKEARDTNFWSRLRDEGMDAFFQLNARRIVDYDSVAELLNAEEPETRDGKGNLINEDKRKRIMENRKYMRETRTLPPPGNADAAQLLGFKLSFYASSARDATDSMPENLIHFTALLIKVGFISLRDIYPHLYPPDEKMPEERTRLEKEKVDKEAKERPGGAPNALALAGLLTDDTLPPAARRAIDKDRSGGTTPKPEKKDEEEQEALPPPPNQKLMLLKALLAHGNLADSLFILGRFPWLIDVDPTLPPYLLRIVKHMLSKMTDATQPLRERSGLSDAREQHVGDAAAGAEGTIKSGVRASKRPPQRWLQLETLSEKEGTPGRYYYTDWADTVPVCRDLDDVLLLCNTFLPILGVKIGQDAVILGTLVRLARQNLIEDGSDANRTRWLELMRRLLVPALSLTKHNPSLTEEVYQLLMAYPITTRFDLYADWFGGRTSRLPDIVTAFNYNRAEVKEVLRRISNDNAKTQARALGKIAYSTPGVLITFMINQLESYSNMIPALVECTKFFPKLAYDVMIWCLIKALSGQGRDRMQGDGMLTSPWLQALSQFVASLFSHYSDLNPSPILQYLASELRNGDSTNLEMFDQVLAEMAGVRSDTEFNDAQVLAMAGGEQLQTQVVQQLADKRHQSKSSALRLMRALADPGLIGQTLISISQERQMYAHHESSKFMPLKVLGNNVDKIQQVFAQYLDVVKTNLTPEEFESAVPDVVSLIAEFGLQPSMAFAISRGVIGYRMNEHDDSKRQQEQEQKKQQPNLNRSTSNADVEMMEAHVKPAVNGESASPPVKSEGSIDAREEKPSEANAGSQEAPTPQANDSSNGEESPWHPVLEPIVERLREATGDLDHRVRTPFFVTFWTLSQSDVVVYTECYHQEIERLQTQINEVMRSRTDKSSTAIEARERKKRELTDVQNKLRAEVKGRIASYTKLSNRLSQQEKHHWFDRSRQHADLDSRHIHLLQECFLPRAMLSALDAHYSFLMLKMLHDKGAPGFSTLHLLTQLFRKQELAALFFQSTALEATHLGRFLHETLKLVASWHGERSLYEKEALGRNKLPGFVTKMENANDPSSWSFMDFETFRRLVFNWHSILSGAMQMCFESGEYMHIRNGIIVLKAVVPTFPAVNFQGRTMLKLVEKISKEDERQDLKLMALSLLAPLKNREPKWVMPQAFRLNEPSKDGKPNSRSTSARPETPQPGTSTPKLNATAPEFKPGVTNGAGATSATGIEDGEVEEEKKAAAKADDAEMKDVDLLKEEENEQDKTSEAQRHSKAASPESQPASEQPPVGPAKDSSRPHSKAPTPAPTGPRAHPSIDGTKREEGSRSSSSQPASRGPESRSSRASHHQGPASSQRSFEGRSGRSDDKFGRLDRPSEVRSSREPSPGHRSRGRTPPGATRGPSRDERSRGAREEGYGMAARDNGAPAMHPRSSSGRERINGSSTSSSERAGHMPSVASAAPPPLPRPAPNPEPNAQPASADTFTNPARLALIQGDAPGRDRESGPHDRDRRRGWESRDDRASSNPSLPAESRHNGRVGAMDPPREPSRRERPTELAPSGPRHGRLNREPSREFGLPPPQQESSYGRLSQPPDAPSGPSAGPRAPSGPGARGGRNFTAPGMGRNEPPMRSPTTNHPPDSPAAYRQPSGRQPLERHGSGQQQSQPDRQPSGPPTPTVQEENIHPSRRGIMGPQLQTNVPAAASNRGAASPTSVPPSGPRGGQGRPMSNAPSGPSPTTGGPPSGPGGRRNERQWQNLNSQMQSSNAAGQTSRTPDVSFRGAAANRQHGFGVSSPMAAPSPASQMEPPLQPGNMSSRIDGPQSRPDSRIEQRQDLFQLGGGAEENRHKHRGEERSERHRSSRNPSRERGREDELPLKPLPQAMGDGRERRGGREERRDREERNRRESGREARGPRGEEARRPVEMTGAFSGPPQPAYAPEWARDGGRGGRRDGPADDGRRGGGRGQPRGEDMRSSRREEERRENGRGPPRDDEGVPDGRKRRHDEVPFEGSKRRRSGR